jgi:hypothetical protein
MNHELPHTTPNILLRQRMVYVVIRDNRFVLLDGLCDHDLLSVAS